MKHNLYAARHRRRPMGVLLAAAVLLLLGGATATPYLSTAVDDAIYILLARSIAHRGAYLNVALLGAPAHAHWPPGFPLLLSPFVRLWPESILALKSVVLATGVGFVLLATTVVVPGEHGRGRIVALLVATNPMVVTLAVNVGSEIPHGLLVLAYLALLRATLDRGRIGTRRLGCLCALLLTAYFVRPITITAFVATLIVAALRRQWRLMAIVGIGFTLAVGTWQVRNWRIAQQGGVDEEHFTMYLRGLLAPGRVGAGAGLAPMRGSAAVVARRTLRHARAYAEAAAAFVAGPFGVSVLGSDTYSHFHMAGFWGRRTGKTLGWRLCAWALGLMMLVGWALALHRRRGPHEVYFAIQVAVLLLYTVQDSRQIAGLAPFLYYYLWSTLALMGRRLVRRRPALLRRARAATAAVLLLLSLVVAATHSGLTWVGTRTANAATTEGLAAIYPDDWAARFMAARWLKARARPDAVVMCQRGIAEALHMECGLTMAPMPRTRDPVRLRREVAQHADYVVGVVGMPAMDLLLASIEAGRAPGLEVLQRVRIEAAEVVVIRNRQDGGASRSAAGLKEPGDPPRFLRLRND